MFILFCPPVCLDQEQDQVHVVQRCAGNPVHITVQCTLGGQVNSGRIDINHLALFRGFDPCNSLAGRLWLGCYDTELPSKDAIHQRRFTDIGAPH